MNRSSSIESGKGASQDTTLKAISKSLGALTPAEIITFQRHLDERMDEAYTRDLWGAAYVMMGGCSDDGLEYFRAWLISRGRSTFEAAMKDPESLTAVRVRDADDCEFESLLYAAMGAYEEAVGKELPRARSERPQEPSGKAWNEDDTDGLQGRYPKLWKKFAHVWGE